MNKLMIKKGSTLFAALLGAAMATSAWAVNFDSTPVFSQDFEDSSTYLSEMSGGSVASTIFGTSAATSDNPSGTVSQGTRTIYNTSTESKFFASSIGGSTGVKKALFTMPSEVTALTAAYKLEFDYFQPAVSWNGYNAKSGLVIQGANGIVATFYSEAAASSGSSSNGYIYNGDDTSDVLVSGFAYGARYADPSASGNAAYWYHVTITADTVGGIRMSVTRANGTITYMDDVKISDTFDVISSLFIYSYANNSLERHMGLDDVVVYGPASAQTFVWTGAEGDGLWKTPGNWSVDDVAQTDAYPGSLDTAQVTLPDQTITVDAYDALGILEFDSSTKLLIDVSSLDTEAAIDILNIADRGSTVFSTSNIEISGVTYSSYDVDNTTDTGIVTLTIWSKTYFVWTDADEDDHLWSNTGNWSYGDGLAVNETPTYGATVIFPSSFTSGTTVNLDAHICGTDQTGDGRAMTLNCDVTFASTSSTIYYMNPSSVDGTGKLTLSNIEFRTPTSSKVTISNDIAFADSVVFYLRGNKSGYIFTGDISGSGSVSFDGDSNGSKEFTLSGSMTEFSGTMAFTGASNITRTFAGDDDTIDLSSAELSIASGATLYLNGSYSDNALKVGSLSGAGTISNSTANDMTLEVGNSTADATSTVALSASGTWTVNKIGSNTQSIGDISNANVTIDAGTLVVLVGSSLGTVTFNGGKLGFDGMDIDKNETVELLATVDFGEQEISNSDFDLVDVSSDDYNINLDYTTDSSKLTVLLAQKSGYAVWTGDGSDKLWTTAGNWALSDGTAASSAPTSGTVVFPSSLDSASVEVNSLYKYSLDFVINTTVTITRTGTESYSQGNAHFFPVTMTGTGKLILDGVYFQTATYASRTINVPVEVTGNKVIFRVRGNTAHIDWMCAITGTGTLNLLGDNSTTQRIYGDMSGFEGTLDIDYTTYIYDSTTANALDLSNAKVDIARNINFYMDSSCTEDTFKIGQLAGSGTLQNNTSSAVTLELGGNDVSFTLSTILSTSNGGWTRKKVGAGTMTDTAATSEAYVIDDGALIVSTENYTATPTTTAEHTLTSVANSDGETTTWYFSDYAAMLHSSKQWYATMAEAFDADSDGTEAIEQLTTTVAEALTVGEGEVFWLLQDSGESYTGVITLQGGTYKIDSNSAGTPAPVCAATGYESKLTCGGNYNYTPAITGGGVLNIPLNSGGKGIRVKGNNSSFTGTIVFQQSEELTGVCGFTANNSLNANMGAVVDADGVTSENNYFRALDMEVTGTVSLNFLTNANTQAGIAVKGTAASSSTEASATIALGENGGDSLLAGAIGLQNVGFLKINKKGSGTLTLGGGFKLGNVTKLGIASSSTDYSGNEQTYKVVVDGGTLTVESGADLSNSEVTLASGVLVTDGFSAQTITDSGATAPTGYAISITGTPGDSQTLAVTLASGYIAPDVTVELEATDATAAATEAATYTIVLSSAQLAANPLLSTDYYTPAAKYDSDTGKYYVMAAFADNITPDFTGLDEGIEPMVLTSTEVTFNISNMKNGLYYGVFASDAPTTKLDISQVTLEQKTEDKTPTLSATINSADTVKFYRVVVSDADNE